MRKLILTLTAISIFLLSTLNSYAESEAYLQPGLVDKIYQANIKSERESRLLSDKAYVEPHFAVVRLVDLYLGNDYFKIDYAANIDETQRAGLTIADQFGKLGDLEFYTQGSFGYSFIEGTYLMTSESDLEVEDTVSLQIVPVSVALTTAYALPYITPSISVGAGTAWLYQSAAIDGVDQSFLLPFYMMSAALTFFPSSGNDAESTFGGITVGMSRERSVGSDNRSKNVVYNVGTKVLL